MAPSARALTFDGLGLHSGAPARLRLNPTPPGSGLRLRRLDLAGAPELVVGLGEVRSTLRQTVLGVGITSASTTEHLLSALAAFGWWDTLIELDGPEVPILDGSALPFAEALADAPRPAPRPLVIDQPVEVELGCGRAIVKPAEGLSIRCRVDFDHPAIGAQEASWQGGSDEFLHQVAPARTFGFTAELDGLRQAGLIAGGSLECALVFDERGPLNPPRFADEPARHKLLDAIGDLALLGRPLQASITLVRPGHELVVALARAIEARANLRG